MSTSFTTRARSWTDTVTPVLAAGKPISAGAWPLTRAVCSTTRGLRLHRRDEQDTISVLASITQSRSSRPPDRWSGGRVPVTKSMTSSVPSPGGEAAVPEKQVRSAALRGRSEKASPPEGGGIAGSAGSGWPCAAAADVLLLLVVGIVPAGYAIYQVLGV